MKCLDTEAMALVRCGGAAGEVGKELQVTAPALLGRNPFGM